MLYSKLRQNESHAQAVKRLINYDLSRRTFFEIMETIAMTIEVTLPPYDKIYRVCIRDSKVEVVCLGLDNVDAEATGDYSSVQELPAWMHDKLAALSLFQCGTFMPVVEGVGRRISEDIFWLFVE